MAGGSATNKTKTLVSVDQALHTARYQFGGNVGDDEPSDDSYQGRMVVNGVVLIDGVWSPPGSHDFSITTSAANDLPADTDCTWRTRCRVYTGFEYLTVNAASLGFKSAAVTATTSTPTSSNVAATTADLACNYFPNVNASTCAGQLQYKRTTDTDWINGGAPGTLGGYVERTATASLTGLDPSTQYQVRLQMTRTTITGTSLTSATASFITLAAAPYLTNMAATGIAHSSAVLNAVLDCNTFAVRVRFEWGPAPEGPPFVNVTDWQEFSGDGDQAVQQAIAGLTASTHYWYNVKVQWPSPGYENEEWSHT